MQNEEGADADRLDHAPGFQNFFPSPRNKKRVLPVAPQQRRVMGQSSLIDSFEESYTEKVIIIIYCHKFQRAYINVFIINFHERDLSLTYILFVKYPNLVCCVCMCLCVTCINFEYNFILHPQNFVFVKYKTIDLCMSMIPYNGLLLKSITPLRIKTLKKVNPGIFNDRQIMFCCV